MKGVRHANRTTHMRPIDNVRCREDREKTPEEDTTTTIGMFMKCFQHIWKRYTLIILCVKKLSFSSIIIIIICTDLNDHFIKSYNLIILLIFLKYSNVLDYYSILVRL